jgi:ABC-type Fe3+/spermidine/putrescine transport system ATPase subunit
VSFSFGSRLALEDVSLHMPAGSLFALLGGSGSGKTTLLRVIGGYLTPARGRVVLGGQDVTALPPERRNVGMVFQSYALFPHLSARRNVAFGLEVRGVPRGERHRRVEEALDRVGLAADARDRRPAGLSGGQQQRVALARALVIEPDVLLLDEPLANLDRRLRDQVRGELRQLQRRTGVTALLVTHDPEEALALADSVGVMASGRLLQAGTPQELYERPCCPYVARLVGEANLLVVEQTGPDGLTVAGGLRISPAPPALDRAVLGDVLLVRPGEVRLGNVVGEPRAGGAAQGVAGAESSKPRECAHRGFEDSAPATRFEDSAPATRIANGDAAYRWPARVLEVSYHGGQATVEVELARTRLLASVAAADRPARGEMVSVHVPGAAFRLLPEADPVGLLL